MNVFFKLHIEPKNKITLDAGKKIFIKLNNHFEFDNEMGYWDFNEEHYVSCSFDVAFKKYSEGITNSLSFLADKMEFSITIRPEEIIIAIDSYFYKGYKKEFDINVKKIKKIASEIIEVKSQKESWV